MASPSLTVSHICIPVQLPGDNRLKFYSIKIKGFATELRTNLLLYIAYIYLHVYSNVPSKRCFAFTWYCYACMGQTGQLAKWGVSLWPCLQARGLAVPPVAVGADAVAAFLSAVLNVTAAWWSSHAITGKASGAQRWLCTTVSTVVEMAVSHTFAHTMSKDIPSPSKCKPKSFDCQCFPALYSFAQGFLFLSTPNKFLSPLKILYFLFFLKTSTSYNLKILPCEFTGKFCLHILE